MNKGHLTAAGRISAGFYCHFSLNFCSFWCFNW